MANEKKLDYSAMHFDKRTYYAQAEALEQGKPLVDILLNFQEGIAIIADRYAVNKEFLLEWTIGVLPLKASNVVEEDPEAED